MSRTFKPALNGIFSLLRLILSGLFSQINLKMFISGNVLFGGLESTDNE